MHIFDEFVCSTHFTALLNQDMNLPHAEASQRRAGVEEFEATGAQRRKERTVRINRFTITRL